MNGHGSRARLAWALVGESFREMAVLIAVFAPLDLVTQSKPLTLRYPLATIALFVVLFALGIALEVKWRSTH
jgi:hypothetical protein